MPKEKNESIINLSVVAKKSGVEYFKLYNNAHGLYQSNTLDANEGRAIINALSANLSPFLKGIGYKVTFEKI
jgi:hypothetical protein